MFELNTYFITTRIKYVAFQTKFQKTHEND